MIVKQYATYIMANNRPTLYTGMTSNLLKRVAEHKNGQQGGFTKRYSIQKLVYYEFFASPMSAIVREKQIKDMNRKDKITMIKNVNPSFEDLSKNL